MPERTRRIPAYVCWQVEVRHLVALDLFEDGGRRGHLLITDPRDLSRDDRLPVDVRLVGEGKAVVELERQVVEAVSRPGLNGRLWWDFTCVCGSPARKLYRPLGMDDFRCGECWRIARPSRSPRWRGVSGEEVARGIAQALRELEARRS